jgi:pimeloyl-ACP methyl ester carboxylesterase
VRASDLQGAGRLVTDAVVGVTDIVEAMHRSIAERAGVVGPPPKGPTRGVTGLVYRSIRSVTRVVGWGLDAALPRLAPVLGKEAESSQREAVVSAVNGVLGDHLVATGNPLAIPMSLRQGGVPLALEGAALSKAFPEAGGKLLVLVHGLCMNDLQWRREGHDHGAALARELGLSPLYLHYNSGCHIATNGREFAQLLERLLQAWPVPVEQLVLIGHSMGGLVCRSACAHAAQEGMHWLRQLDAMVFLGTPHHGAPLERAGSKVDAVLDFSPYTAPFSRLGRIRSAGIQDLRHGRVLGEGSSRKRCVAWAALAPRRALPCDRRVQAGPCAA